MNLIKKHILVLLGICSGFVSQAQPVAVFCGGDMYQNIEKKITTMKLSGFNTVIFWSVHIYPNGSLILNDSEIIVNGEYVGKENWPLEVKKLKEQPTSVNRIEFSIGAWSVPDFENIEALIAKEGVGENSILYRNFKKLKEITGADAIDFDDESNYDVTSTVAFSEMLIKLGYKITLCPYKNKTFWQSVYNQVRAKHPYAVDHIYLQCYAGGASNTPAAWNDLFAGLDVSPGLWWSNGTSCNEGLDWRSVKNKLNGWKSSGIDGAFIWVFDDILKCSIGGTAENYATAIREVLEIKTIAPGKAFQPKPSDYSKEVSVDQNLKWIPGSFDAKHKVYLGTDSVLTANNLLGTVLKSEFEPGTVKNNSASTEYPDSNFGKSKIVDGIVGIHGQGEWASNGQTTPWVKLTLEKEKKINKIILYDRANSVDLIKNRTLSFSDGSTIEVMALPNEGGSLEISFSEKSIIWVKFQVVTVTNKLKA